MCRSCGPQTNESVRFADPESGTRFGLLEAPSLLTPVTNARLPLPSNVGSAPVTGSIRMRDGGAIHQHVSGTNIQRERDLLAKNQQIADSNRQWFAEHQVLALNLLSSPGSGKTTLLERSIRGLRGSMEINVIEGDQATLNDAQRCRLQCDPDQHRFALSSGRRRARPRIASTQSVRWIGNYDCKRWKSRLPCSACFGRALQGRNSFSDRSRGHASQGSAYVWHKPTDAAQ